MSQNKQDSLVISLCGNEIFILGLFMKWYISEPLENCDTENQDCCQR